MQSKQERPVQRPGGVGRSGVDRRGETPLQRADRTWDVLFNGLRLLQTSVVILFSLLLTVPFSAGFGDVDGFQRQVYLVALLLAATACVVLVAPVAYHRVLFGQRPKRAVLRASKRFALMGMGLLCLALSAALLLVADLLLPRGYAISIAMVFGAGTARLWTVPAALRRPRS